MKNANLRVQAVRYLKAEVEKVAVRPHELTYSAKQVSEAVGGYAGALGQVADEVANDLKAMGIGCKYLRSRKPTVFVLSIKDA